MVIKPLYVSHKMDKPVREFISAVLDITAVQPLIESCTGYDLITREDLSDFERGMKAVNGLASLFTLGQGSIVMNEIANPPAMLGRIE